MLALLWPLSELQLYTELPAPARRANQHWLWDPVPVLKALLKNTFWTTSGKMAARSGL